MPIRTPLSAVAVSVLASVILGGLPGGVSAAAASGGPFGPLTPALTARLSQDVDEPVIVLLKSQAGGAPALALAPAAARAAQASLDGELRAVRATAIKRFTLVNSIAATVSALEAQRLAADPAVSRVIPDARFTMPGRATAPAVSRPGEGRAPAASLPLHTIPGACPPASKSLLAPEGLALTGTASDSATASTARSLGFTGAGVKVAFLADGLDPGNANLRRGAGQHSAGQHSAGGSVFADYRDFTGNGPGATTGGEEAFLDANTIAGQGSQVYDINGFAAQGYPGGCAVQIGRAHV